MQADTLQVVVRRRRQQGENVVVLDLAGVDDAALPPFEAGAHVDVHLPSGLVRQYSLCGDPADRRAYRLGVLRDAASRGGSLAVHEVLGEGVRLAISRPRNHFPLVAGARHSVLVGGGIGITPMIAMAHALAAAGASFELHYCLRSPSSGGFVDELKAAPFADRVSFHFSVGGGRIDPAAVLDRCGREGTQLYVCGPAGFMDAVMDAAALPKAQMHREHFGAEVDTSGGGFEVVAQASGKTVSVAPGQTIVAALADIGIRIEVSCQEGVCGTCVCTVLEGECDHRDVYLTEDEREAHDQIMTCCSRARSSSLVLDV